MKKYRTLLRSIAFLLLLLVVIYSTQDVFGIDDAIGYTNLHSFNLEKKGKLDAVYVGASDVYAFWTPLFGWRDRGIAVWNYAFPAMYAPAVIYYVKQAQKRQPNALYIFSLNTFKDPPEELELRHIHRVADYQPLSLDKLRVIKLMTERSRFKGLDALEFYFPIIRFHSRWDSLDSQVFGDTEDNYKSSDTASMFRSKVKDFSGQLEIYNTRAPLPDEIGQSFAALLDYLDEQRLNALFIKVPQVVDEEIQGRMNTMKDMAGQRGYPCLDLMEEAREIGIDPTWDYYNAFHTNIHGSLKVTEALGKYLVDNYAFEDKRGQAGWESWDSSAERYEEYMSQFTLPFERDHAPRVDSDVPVLGISEVEAHSVRLEWTGTRDAAGYEVFRKGKKGAEKCWRSIGVFDSQTRALTDADLKAATQYTYTIVPRYAVGGETAYGRFSTVGMTITTKGE